MCRYATLHPGKPVTMGAFAMSDYFTEMMKAKDEALKNSKKTILAVWEEWAKMFGRTYKPVETYKADDAEILLLTMGSMGETAEMAIDELRAKGLSVGLVKLRLWRPFPFEEIKASGEKSEKTDCYRPRRFFRRARRTGFLGNKVCPLCMKQTRPMIYNYIIGLGGRDVAVTDFTGMIEKVVQEDTAKR